MATQEEVMDTTGSVISPTSLVRIFKLDVVACNGQPIGKLELASVDIEQIWSDSLLCELNDITGYTSFRTKGNSEIRIQYQLRNPTSIKSIAFEPEFSHERVGPQGVENLKCRVVGLAGVRQAKIGEKVKLTINTPNFDLTPEQALEWISKYAEIHGEPRYFQNL